MLCCYAGDVPVVVYMVGRVTYRRFSISTSIFRPPSCRSICCWGLVQSSLKTRVSRSRQSSVFGSYVYGALTRQDIAISRNCLLKLRSAGQLVLRSKQLMIRSAWVAPHLCAYHRCSSVQAPNLGCLLFVLPPSGQLTEITLKLPRQTRTITDHQETIH